MAGVTGITSSKLFKIRTIDLNEPFKVGVNGVTQVQNLSPNLVLINYTLDDIDYTTPVVYQDKIINSVVIDNKENLIRRGVGFTLKGKKITNRTSGEDITVKKIKNTNQYIKFEPDPKSGGIQGLVRAQPISETKPTRYVTKKLSYDFFNSFKIYKNNKYTGLIDKPKVTSDVFMERDVGSVFERHQRLSEINSVSDLVNYQNGYFNVTNTF